MTDIRLARVQQQLGQLRQELRNGAFPEKQQHALLHIIEDLERIITQLRLIPERTEGDASEDHVQHLRGDTQFTTIFNLAPLPITISSLDEGRMHDVNEAFLHTTGYRREEVIGRTALDLGLYVNPAARKQLVERLSREGPRVKDFEFAFATKAGEVRHALGSFERLELAGSSYILGMYYDITDRKRGEEELHRAVQAVMQDTAWFSQALMERLAAIRSGTPDQTEVAELRQRERQVLVRIAKGMSNEEIAAELGIANQTVRNYISTIYEKLGVRSRAEAIVWARERGLTGG